MTQKSAIQQHWEGLKCPVDEIPMGVQYNCLHTGQCLTWQSDFHSMRWVYRQQVRKHRVRSMVDAFLPNVLSATVGHYIDTVIVANDLLRISSPERFDALLLRPFVFCGGFGGGCSTSWT